MNIAQDGNIRNFNSQKPLSTETKARLTVVFEWSQYPMLHSRAVNNYYNILNINFSEIYRLHYVWFQNNPVQVNICAYILIFKLNA